MPFFQYWHLWAETKLLEILTRWETFQLQNTPMCCSMLAAGLTGRASICWHDSCYGPHSGLQQRYSAHNIHLDIIQSGAEYTGLFTFVVQVLFLYNKTRKCDNVRVAPKTLVKAVLIVSSIGCNNERQSLAKVSYSAIDYVLTNLLPAGLQNFFQVLNVSNATTDWLSKV